MSIGTDNDHDIPMVSVNLLQTNERYFWSMESMTEKDLLVSQTDLISELRLSLRSVCLLPNADS